MEEPCWEGVIVYTSDTYFVVVVVVFLPRKLKGVMTMS